MILPATDMISNALLHSLVPDQKTIMIQFCIVGTCLTEAQLIFKRHYRDYHKYILLPWDMIVCTVQTRPVTG